MLNVHAVSGVYIKYIATIPKYEARQEMVAKNNPIKSLKNTTKINIQWERLNCYRLIAYHCFVCESGIQLSLHHVMNSITLTSWRTRKILLNVLKISPNHWSLVFFIINKLKKGMHVKSKLPGTDTSYFTFKDNNGDMKTRFDSKRNKQIKL